MSGKKEIPEYVDIALLPVSKQASGGVLSMPTAAMSRQTLRAYFPPEEYKHDE